MIRPIYTLIIPLLIIFTLGCFAGAIIDRARTREEPRVELISPLTESPRPDSVVIVVYPWGTMCARYLPGDAARKDIWLEFSPLHDGEAAYDLLEQFGLPVWWSYLPAVPQGLKDKSDEK
jgi:hypothetical protein